MKRREGEGCEERRFHLRYLGEAEATPLPRCSSQSDAAWSVARVTWCYRRGVAFRRVCVDACTCVRFSVLQKSAFIEFRVTRAAVKV